MIRKYLISYTISDTSRFNIISCATNDTISTYIEQQDDVKDKPARVSTQKSKG